MIGTYRIGLTSKALTAASGLLALIVLLQLVFPAAPSVDSIQAEGDVAALLPDFGASTVNPPAMAELPDMLERPLFFVDRRMPELEAEAAPPPAPLRLKLEGVALSGGARVAVLRNLANNQLVQFEEGDTHDGWTLDSLTSTSATFSRNGEQGTELLLDPVDSGRRR
jgi:hypothetical protein